MKGAGRLMVPGIKQLLLSLILYIASVPVMLAMYGSPSQQALPSESFIKLYGTYSHELLNALFYTPACIVLLVPSLAGIASSMLIVRRNGFADAVKCTLRDCLLLALAAGMTVSMGLALEAAFIGCMDAAGSLFWLLWTLAVCSYFISCALLLVAVCIAAGERAAVIVALGYGFFGYFLGASPLRSIDMLHFGWMIGQDMQNGVGNALAVLLRQLFICIAILSSIRLMAEVCDAPSGGEGR